MSEREPSDLEIAPTLTADGEPSGELRELLGMTPRRPPLVLQPGQRIGDSYMITRKLGAGGMGVVYLARDEALERDVAIKIHPVSAAERLAREAAAIARLVHPNVVTVHQIARFEGNPFVVMEYVPGGTARSWLAARPRSTDEILALYTAAGRGLAAAHAARLVHRDFKPDNVLVGDDGRARVADFGLAHDGAEATEPGVMGTPAYMAPEQRAGGDVGPAADQFAFAVSLWEALCGERPVLQTDASAPPAPRRMPAHVYRALVVALATDPARRFASMDALLAALAIDPRRQRRRIALAGVAAVIVGTAIVVGVLIARTSEATWRPSVVELLPAYDEHSTYPSISPDGMRVAFASNHETPGRYRVYVAPLLGGDARAVTPPELNAIAVRWMRDANALLVTTRSGEKLTVLRFPLDGGPAAELGTTFFEAVDDCGGGRVLLVPYGVPGCPTCSALVLREADGRLREAHRGAPGELFARASCAPDGRRIAFSVATVITAEPPADLWVLEIDGGPPRRLTHDNAYNLTPVFHPDGRSIVFSSMRGGKRNLWEIPVGGGTPSQLTSGEGPDIGPAITPDGRVLVYNVDITSWPLVAHEPGLPPRRITGRLDLDAPSVTPDGSEVIAEANEPTGKRVVAIAVADATVRDLTAGSRPAVSLDGLDVLHRGEPDHDRLRVVPRAGGASRELGVVPGTIEAIRVGADGWAHLSVVGVSGAEAWRIPLAGGAAERDAEPPWVFVSPAPAGGWRAFVRVASEFEREATLVSPGASLADPQNQLLRLVTADWDPSGDAFVYFAPPWVRRRDVTSGRDTPIVQGGDFLVLAAGPAGVIYTIDRQSRARRMAITNYGARPRPE